jgi:hypothetical protein
VAGFPKYFKIFALETEGKICRDCNNNIDAVAIKQVSDEEDILLEISYKSLSFYGASLYFEIDPDIERDIGKVEEIIELTKGKGLILSINSKSRSKLWHDKYTNQRGEISMDFIITSDLVITNEATGIQTFETTRGHSWIYLTLCNNRMTQNIRGWTCREVESCLDQKLIQFDIEVGESDRNIFNHDRTRYKIKTEDWENLITIWHRSCSRGSTARIWLVIQLIAMKNFVET